MAVLIARHARAWPGRRLLSSSAASGIFRSGKQAGRWYDVWRVTSDGSRQRGPISHQQLLVRASLFPRDVLTFDVSSQSSSQGTRPPRILVRESAILLTAGHLRCVICRDEVFLFDAERPVITDFARQLSFKLISSAAVETAAQSGVAHWKNTPPTGPSRAPDDTDGADSIQPHAQQLGAHDELPPFEMRALDLLLEEVTASYARRAALLTPMVESLLERMVIDAAPYSAAGLGLGDVSMLLPMQDSLNGFELEASGLVGVLVGLLDSDEDMLDMLLTEKAARGGQRPPAAHHESVELLLEEYVRQMAWVVTDAQALKKRVASASELAQLHLDISRNRMVATNVHLSMVSTTLAVVMTVSGVFGMNLTHGLENDAVAFQIVTASSAALGACMLAASWSYLHGFRGGHRQQQLFLQLQSANAIRTVFRRLDSLQYVLANKLRTPSAAAPTPAIAALPVHEGGTMPLSAAAAAAAADEAASDAHPPLSLGVLRREVEAAEGTPLGAQEFEIIARMLARSEAGRDVRGASGGADGGRLSSSQVAALWRRVALPRDLWFASDAGPPPRPAGAPQPGSAPAGDGPGGAGGGARGDAPASARTAAHAEPAEHSRHSDALFDILDRRRAPQPRRLPPPDG